MNKQSNQYQTPILLRVAHAAELLDMSRSSVYQLINEGIIPAVRINGRSIRVPYDQLQEWIKSQALKG